MAKEWWHTAKAVAVGERLRGGAAELSLVV